MSSTRYSMGEQVQNRLSGGKGKAAGWADIREIYKAIEQVLNAALKMDYFKTTLDTGDTTPDGLSTATYENVPVTTYANCARLKLPANYIRLPHGLGIPYVGPQNPVAPNNILTSQFIPIPMGHTALLNGLPMISDLLGQIGYEVHGLDVIFKDDITLAPNNITACRVKLVVMDISQYGDYDFLPIPADLEAPCVEQVYQMFAGQPAPNKIDDPIAIKQPGK